MPTQFTPTTRPNNRKFRQSLGRGQFAPDDTATPAVAILRPGRPTDDSLTVCKTSALLAVTPILWKTRQRLLRIERTHQHLIRGQSHLEHMIPQCGGQNRYLQ